ncbi:MAG: hypothetical protein ACP5I3_00285 [Thermoproteus sp.]|jgi:hypothetical protein
MEAKTRAGSKVDRVAGVRSADIANAVRYIVAGDNGDYYLVALSGDRPLYTYSIRYEPAGYSILGKAELKCAKCGGSLTKFYVYRDLYGECERGHLNHVGVIVAWLRPGEESEEL